MVKQLIEQRYPNDWGGAAAIRVEDGTIYTSVAPDVINASTELCMKLINFKRKLHILFVLQEKMSILN